MKHFLIFGILPLGAFAAGIDVGQYDPLMAKKAAIVDTDGTSGLMDVPAIRRALTADFTYIREPASWCVADAFQAAVRLLRGEDEYRPGKVYGFLSRPKGVSEPTEVSAADLKAAAAKLDLSTFIPAEIAVGAQAIGPADFLFAALEILETGAESVKVVPREQLGSFKEVPGIEKMKIAGKWIHPDSFKDEFLSDRLRLQLWTLRIE